MFGVVAAGHFSRVEEPQSPMSGPKDVVFEPNPGNCRVYDRLLRLYRRLHGAFGIRELSEKLFEMIKELLEIKRSVL